MNCKMGTPMASLRSDSRGVIVACPSCGQANRLPYDQLGASTRCGKCQTDLGSPSLPVDSGSSVDFDALVRASSLPVLVDFWAAWCGPCRMVAPEMATVAARHAGEWLVVKVDTEAVPDLAARLQIQSIPTMAVYQSGLVAGRKSGAMPADQIEAFVRQSLLGR
jgi:thioredoxin 2